MELLRVTHTYSFFEWTSVCFFLSLLQPSVYFPLFIPRGARAAILVSRIQ